MGRCHRVPRVGVEPAPTRDVRDVFRRYHVFQGAAAQGRVGGHFTPRLFSEFRRAREMVADRGCADLVRVAAELCLQPPEARQFRVPSFRRQVVPQVVKVRRPHSPLVETGQDVRREVVDGGLEAGGRDRFRVRRADIGKQHRIRFRRRLGGEERQQPVRKDRDVGPKHSRRRWPPYGGRNPSRARPFPRRAARAPIATATSSKRATRRWDRRQGEVRGETPGGRCLRSW